MPDSDAAYQTCTKLHVPAAPWGRQAYKYGLVSYFPPRACIVDTRRQVVTKVHPHHV